MKDINRAIAAVRKPVFSESFRAPEALPEISQWQRGATDRGAMNVAYARQGMEQAGINTIAINGSLLLGAGGVLCVGAVGTGFVRGALYVAENAPVWGNAAYNGTLRARAVYDLHIKSSSAWKFAAEAYVTGTATEAYLHGCRSGEFPGPSGPGWGDVVPFEAPHKPWFQAAGAALHHAQRN